MPRSRAGGSAPAFDTLVAQGERRRIINQHRGAIGFCFGGGNVLELARDGGDLHGVVSIHGDLKTAAPAAKGAVKASLLVLHGVPDPVVPKEHRDAFESEMDAAGAKWEMVLFSGILHAYTDRRTPTCRASPPTTRRPRGRATPSCTRSWRTPLRGGCDAEGRVANGEWRIGKVPPDGNSYHSLFAIRRSDCSNDREPFLNSALFFRFLGLDAA